jgi:hypothetical protein
MKTPNLGLITAIVVVVACTAQPETVRPSPSASAPPAFTSSPGPTANATPRTEVPEVLLDVAVLPPVSERPGWTTSRVGGISSMGPTSLAIDRDGLVYLWDQARLRVVIYEKGRYVREIPLLSISPDAQGLLVYGDRLYLTDRATPPSAEPDRMALEHEIDLATGRVLRVALADSGASLYPRARAYQPRGVPPLRELGADALGFRYQYDTSSSIRRFRRLDANGRTLAEAVEPVPNFLTDWYVAADGGLYGLVDRSAADGHVFVYRLLAAAGTVPRETVPAITVAPKVAGYGIPDAVTVMYTGLPQGELAAREREALWWLLSLTPEAPDRPAPDRPILRLTASWSDGRKMDVASDGRHASIDGRTLRATITALDPIAAWSVSRPGSLAALARSGATIEITDLQVARALSAPEREALAVAIESSFWVRERELPRPLEDPFPRYRLRLAGTVSLQPVGDRYVSFDQGGALAAQPFSELARSWLPVPPLSEPADLFAADHVVIRDPTGEQDISRWKASIVRALVGVSSPGTYPGASPYTLALSFGGARTEIVSIDIRGYTYRGTFYPRPGLLSILGYRGVP